VEFWGVDEADTCMRDARAAVAKARGGGL